MPSRRSPEKSRQESPSKEDRRESRGKSRKDRKRSSSRDPERRRGQERGRSKDRRRRRSHSRRHSASETNEGSRSRSKTSRSRSHSRSRSRSRSHSRNRSHRRHRTRSRSNRRRSHKDDRSRSRSADEEMADQQDDRRAREPRKEKNKEKERDVTPPRDDGASGSRQPVPTPNVSAQKLTREEKLARLLAHDPSEDVELAASLEASQKDAKQGLSMRLLAVNEAAAAVVDDPKAPIPECVANWVSGFLKYIGLWDDPIPETEQGLFGHLTRRTTRELGPHLFTYTIINDGLVNQDEYYENRISLLNTLAIGGSTDAIGMGPNDQYVMKMQGLRRFVRIAGVLQTHDDGRRINSIQIEVIDGHAVRHYKTAVPIIHIASTMARLHTYIFWELLAMGAPLPELTARLDTAKGTRAWVCYYARTEEDVDPLMWDMFPFAIFMANGGVWDTYCLGKLNGEDGEVKIAAQCPECCPKKTLAITEGDGMEEQGPNEAQVSLAEGVFKFHQPDSPCYVNRKLIKHGTVLNSPPEMKKGWSACAWARRLTAEARNRRSAQEAAKGR